MADYLQKLKARCQAIESNPDFGRRLLAMTYLLPIGSLGAFGYSGFFFALHAPRLGLIFLGSGIAYALLIPLAMQKGRFVFARSLLAIVANASMLILSTAMGEASNVHLHFILLLGLTPAFHGSSEKKSLILWLGLPILSVTALYAFLFPYNWGYSFPEAWINDFRLANLGAIAAFILFILLLLFKHFDTIRNELENAKSQAEAANKAKGEFIANLNHELRTPLNAIFGYSQILMTQNLPKVQHENVSVIHASGQALLTIINDILDLSKIETGSFRMESRPFDPIAISRLVTEMLGGQAAEKALNLIGEFVETSELALGDSGRMRQVLTNLLGNAIKFTEHGQVSLKVYLGHPLKATAPNLGKKVFVFEVEDTGLGVSLETQSRLFQRFVQEGSGTGWNRGTGLGLAISLELVKKMNGQMGFTSQVGKGSCFWFTLPTA